VRLALEAGPRANGDSISVRPRGYTTS